MATDGEDLTMLTCTVFASSTRVTDGQTDRQTELRWLRHVIAYMHMLSCAKSGLVFYGAVQKYKIGLFFDTQYTLIAGVHHVGGSKRPVILVQKTIRFEQGCLTYVGYISH